MTSDQMVSEGTSEKARTSVPKVATNSGGALCTQAPSWHLHHTVNRISGGPLFLDHVNSSSFALQGSSGV